MKFTHDQETLSSALRLRGKHLVKGPGLVMGYNIPGVDMMRS